MKNIVGNPARGENFFKRDHEVKKILNSLHNDNNIQIAAPRRVGKTSILFYMLDNLVEGYRYVYVDTESVNSEEDFYKKLLKEILKLDGMESIATRFMKAAGAAARKIKSIKVAEVGIELKDAEQGLSYYEDLVHFLSGIQLEENRKLILLIDEFPQTILNIVNADGTESAIRFLQSNRTLRLDPDIINNVRFIYTGSIGLNHTVAAIDSTAFINDLNTLEIGPLNEAEARLLLDQLLAARNVTITPAASDHLLKKLEWLIPFHIQLLVQELLRKEDPGNCIDVAPIDQAFEEIIAARNDNHFAHYFSRLKVQFKGDELNYVLEILKMIAESGTITRVQLLDQSARFNTEDHYRKIVEILVYDGYINNIGDGGTYRFNSPVVRMWWLKYICK
ncbi:MAG TPA: AAA family ATPase [Puia sp.]|nr:AAA family ATPase [Puia sp.]